MQEKKNSTASKKSVSRKRKPKKKKSLGRVLFILFMTAAAAVFLAIVGYLIIILQGERMLQANLDKIEMPEASIVLDREGNEIGKLLKENREYVSLKEMPDLLVEAFVATEDRRFYDHSGIDFISIGRAVVKDIMARGLVEGGSTITQQLARNLFLDNDKNFLRKATEASIAIALENKFTKNEILEMYLNRIYLGSGTYGVKAAAKHFFNKELDQLEIWEIATLAGLPKAPSTLNPMADPQASKERRAVVLSLMKEMGLISEEERKAAAEVDYVAPNIPEDDHYASYMDYVIEEIKAKTGLTEEQLNMNGYRITTAINTQAQLAMEEVFSDPANFPEDGTDQIVQAAMTIVDHRDGTVVAMIGGRDYANRGFNRATSRNRQPGSSFKPLVAYAPAMETGDWGPDSLLKDEKMSFGGYSPNNYNNRYQGQVTMRTAIRDSINVPAVWLLNEIGVKTGMDYVEELGIDLDDENDRNLAIALGGLTGGVSTLEMAQAYGMFGNGGMWNEAHAVLKIEDSEGNLIYEYDPNTKRMMSEENAYAMTDMLVNVVQNGTGKAARMDRPVAGKTGTTQIGIEGITDAANRDIWFAGYTPEWSAAVWVGFDNTNEDNYLVAKSAAAAEIFSSVMTKAMEGMKVQSFPAPKGYEEQEEEEEEVEPPKQATGLTAEFDPFSNSVLLNWNDAGEGLQYNIYRQTAGEEAVHLLTSKSTEVEDMTVQLNTSYKYYVTVLDPETELESEPSEKVEVVTPEEPFIPEPTEPIEPDESNSGGNTGGNLEQPPVGEEDPPLEEQPPADELPIEELPNEPAEGDQPPGENDPSTNNG
ncbi:transglycosylase domain-containing protein [Marinicrinis lubricantis]|uniref:PBP1A family penicillin-binding protein n=1 Tax=Marinicrinis lubricantis TaxID=2086470 RepID=A0ABW1IUF1_9BACL